MLFKIFLGECFSINNRSIGFFSGLETIDTFIECLKLREKERKRERH
jgi:hypothetical protein